MTGIQGLSGNSNYQWMLSISKSNDLLSSPKLNVYDEWLDVVEGAKRYNL